jgi:4-hydroxy-tetrahydrodipicolinate synthase
VDGLTLGIARDIGKRARCRANPTSGGIMTLKLKGASTALITPFRDGEVDHDALRALVERQIDGGIDGLVPCGTTGEAATMSEDEQLSVVRTVVEQANGEVPIIAGTGSNDTAQTVRYTRRVSEIEGVDAALVVTPYYNKPGQQALIRHFRTIADEGGLPVVLYNVPGRTGVSMTADTIATLAEHPNIIAVKEATGDMVFASEIRQSIPRDFSMLSGDDFTTMPFLALGGDGCISVVSNIDPGAMSEMYAAGAADAWDRARQLHYRLLPLANALFAETNPVGVKTAASILGWCTDELRAPLYAPGADLRELITAALTEHGALKE